MNVYLTEEQLEAWHAFKLGCSAEEYHRYRREHANIFGHINEPNFETREYCDHPMHYAFAMAMNGGNLTQARPELIAPSTVATEDDAEIDPRFGTKEYNDRLAGGWDGVIREIER